MLDLKQIDLGELAYALEDHTDLMAIPDSVKEAALREVETFCEQRIPPDLRDRIRLESSIRGDAITIVELRPPWRADYGPEWSSSKIAQLRYEPESGAWSLYCRDSRERWHHYIGLRTSRSVAPLLREIDADSTGIFWG